MRALDRGRGLPGSQGRARGEGGPSTPSSPSGPSWTARSQAAARIAARSGSSGRLGADQAEGFGEIGAGAARGVGKDVVDRLREGLVRLRLVQDGEARRHVGLEGDEVQKALAEGVQGLDLEAARRLHGPGEQAAGEPDLRGPGRSPDSSASSAASAILVQGHPAAEPLVDADRHGRGGGSS